RHPDRHRPGALPGRPRGGEDRRGSGPHRADLGGGSCHHRRELRHDPGRPGGRVGRRRPDQAPAPGQGHPLPSMVSDAPRPTGAAPASAATLWLAGLTAGLLTGIGEVLYHVWRTQTRTSDGLGAHVAWMAPLSNLLWFLPLAGLLVLLRRRIPLPVAIGLLAALLSLCLLYLRPRLYDLTALLIATGVGVQAARLTRSRTAGVARWVRRLAPGLVGLVVLAGGVVAFREWRAERRAVAALPAAGGQTNVLLLVLDTVRAMELSVYGFERPTTPGMEKWAREGVVFERAFSTSPWTLPGHASLFTGRWAHELSARWDRPLDATT